MTASEVRCLRCGSRYVIPAGAPVFAPVLERYQAEAAVAWLNSHQPCEPVVRTREAQCGTRSGLNRHRRLGEPACAACRAADNEYKRPWATL